jgi:serine/threonine protein phosphatase PrpC
MAPTTSLNVQAGNPECQDRAEIISCGDRTILVLADGAGGISGGAPAADLFVQLVRASSDRLRTAEDCAHLLVTIDRELAHRNDCGETTAVIVIVDASHIFGASVGDSAARLFTKDGAGELTYGQQRKPLLGSGSAFARPFNWPIEEGTVVVASDGLWKYAPVEAIASRARTRDSADLALRLAELARLPSGAFQDDVAVITCRID